MRQMNGYTTSKLDGDIAAFASPGIPTFGAVRASNVEIFIDGGSNTVPLAIIGTGVAAGQQWGRRLRSSCTCAGFSEGQTPTNSAVFPGVLD